MSIRIKLKGPHSCPTVLCDQCGQEISEAKDGNYSWDMDAMKEEGGAEVLFTHKRCFRSFDKTHRYWGSMELSVFPIYLERNLELERAEAEETARLFATI